MRNRPPGITGQPGLGKNAGIIEGTGKQFSRVLYGDFGTLLRPDKILSKSISYILPCSVPDIISRLPGSYRSRCRSYTRAMPRKEKYNGGK